MADAREAAVVVLAGFAPPAPLPALNPLPPALLVAFVAAGFFPSAAAATGREEGPAVSVLDEAEVGSSCFISPGVMPFAAARRLAFAAFAAAFASLADMPAVSTEVGADMADLREREMVCSDVMW